VVPGYGGMPAAKAALESDTRTLAWEAGRRWGIRVNCISAAPLPSRAAKSIEGFAEIGIVSAARAPLQRQSQAAWDVGNAAAFLLSDMAAGVTGVVLPVDYGMHAMSAAYDHK